MSPVQMFAEVILPHHKDEIHHHFIRAALEMAENALRGDEVPVGCVFVRNGEIIGRGMNDTNRSLCVTLSSFSPPDFLHA